MKLDLRDAVRLGVLVGDGAMGTYLNQLGFPISVSYEEYNLLKPDVIRDVHRRYYEAGARFIETNTFSANREKLSKFGLEQETVAINQAGVRLAREAVGSDAYVIGAVGSIRAGRRKFIPRSHMERDFTEQIEALLEEGVDGLLLETFHELDELLLALQIAKASTNVPIIAQFAADGSGVTQDGTAIQEALVRTAGAGADVVGFNCISGPYGMLRLLEKLQLDPNLPLSAFPNAGLPSYSDGQYAYMAGPDYFAESALRFASLGARIVGGCCGTTPDHVAAMAKALADYKLGEHHVATQVIDRTIEVRERMKPEVEVTVEKREPSLVEIAKQRHTVMVEWDTPRDLSIEKFMSGAAELQEAGVDALTMADNSLAQTRMSNLPLGYLVQEKLGIRSLLHIACRDRNLIGTQSHLMGLHALGIDHALVVTGDPARVGDLPGASSVYDLTSFELIRMMKQMNEGIAFNGRPLKHKTQFIVGAAFDPNVKYLDKAVQRMEKKVAAGADYFMTQPVYDPLLIERVAEATKHIPVPIFIGIMPVMSGRNTEFLHNEVPGIRISDHIRNRMNGLEGEQGRRMGVEIGKELLDAAIQHFRGIYLMTPMMFSNMTAELTRYVWEKTKRQDIPLSNRFK